MARVDITIRIYTYLTEVREGSVPQFPVLTCERVKMLCSFMCSDGAKSDVLQVKPREQQILGALQFLC